MANKTLGSFSRCYPNISTVDEYNQMMAHLQGKINHTFKVYHGWLALVPATFGLIFTTIFFVAVLRAIRLHRLSRKCYILILNRASGDIFACLTAFVIIGYSLLSTNVDRLFMQVVDVFFIGCFWTGMVSYVSLSLMKLYAIWRPLSYRNNVTIKRCVQVAVASWVIFIVYLVYSIGSVAAVKNEYLHEARLTGCKLETCQRIMYKVRNIVGIVDYLFTIGCFLVIVFLVRKARKFASSFHQKSDKEGKKPKTIGNRFPMWKIALNVATFACFHSFYAVWNAFMLYNRDPCLFQRNWVIMQKILGVVRFGLLCRIVMDPVLSFITDFQVRRSVLQLLGISQKKAREFSTSEERTTGTMVETISPSHSVRTNHKISNASTS